MELAELSPAERELYRAALKARANAYAPYSHFAVGAAVRCADGKIFCGCNVENASYGLSCCAERNAVFAAVAAGYRSFAALCVAGEDSRPLSPCGACRQVLAEFGVEKIILANTEGKAALYAVEDLLPYPFVLKKTDDGEKHGS